jgi:hypothetical protein
MSPESGKDEIKSETEYPGGCLCGALRYHIWTESRIDWFETADELPRYPDGGPDEAG